jgi:hypothetical protein
VPTGVSTLNQSGNLTNSRMRELGSQRSDVFLIPQTELRTQIYDCCAATAGWAWLGAFVAADPCSVARYASDAQDVAAVWARRMG